MRNYAKIFSKILLPVLTAFLAGAAFSQGATGRVEGTVTDQNTAVVPGVTISIESKDPSTEFKKNVTTNENGYFVFIQIPPGMYRVTVNRTGLERRSVCPAGFPAQKTNQNRRATNCFRPA